MYKKTHRGFGLGGVFRGASYQQGFGLGGVFRGSAYQKGYGLGGIWSKFYNFVAPFFSRAKENLMPLLKSTASHVGNEIISSASNIARDLVKGNDVKNSAVENINQSIDNLTKPQTGSGSINNHNKRKIGIKSKNQMKLKSLYKKFKYMIKKCRDRVEK